MKIIDIFALALKNIFRGGSRSALCVLAIGVGICSVGTIITLGDTAGRAVASEIETLGLGGITFYAQSGTFAVGGADIAEVARVQGVKAAMPLAINSGSIWAKGDKQQSGVCAVNEALGYVFNINLLHGRLFLKSDISKGAKVAVIDDAMAVALYSRTNIVGKSIGISFKGTYDTYEIIGVIESQKQGLETLVGGNIPSITYIPYTVLASDAAADKLAVSCMAGYDESKVSDSVQQLLEKKHGLIIKYENLNKYISSLSGVTQIIALFAVAVAAISVVVGGIGVMNSMVSSVEARIKEIGIYLSIGAKRRDIMYVFLFEAQLLCAAGGILGLAFSLVIGYLVKSGFDVSVWLTTDTALLCLAGSLVCGTFFGILPAYKGASMEPIDAIRSE